MRPHTIRFQPSGVAIVADADESLLAVARRAGVVLDAPCAGEGICGKCAVYLPPTSRTNVHPSSVDGDDRLTADAIAAGMVLACQSRVHGDVEVFLPEAHPDSGIRILTEGYTGEFTFDPHIRKQYYPAEYITGVFAGVDSIGYEPGDTTLATYAVAVDIGTTTLVASLLDLATGTVLATESSLNPQALHAQDVLSRIKTAATEEGLTRLHGMLRDAINKLIGNLTSASGVQRHHVYEVALSGNTCMLHLATGTPTASLGKYPYTPAIRGGTTLPASDIDIKISPFGQIYLPPIIGPYVGADIVSGILVTGLERRPGVVLFVDIGTNGEIVLSDNGRMLAASTAAGPAFEGMNIRCGMRAEPGAIERFQIGADLTSHAATIGGCGARGICGSGLVDIVAELLRVGIVASNGRMAKPGSVGIPALEEHLLLLEGKPAFCLDGAICLTQTDIRHLQLAKGAIRAGIETLLTRTGRTAHQVDEVIIAGSFGYHLRVESLRRMGLLPPDLRDCVRFVGNTSRTGAESLLLHAGARQHIHELVEQVEVIELADDANFQAVFMRSVAFG